MEFTLVLPAFIAGVLTFLAPCTLPLVPAYLSFISGLSREELKDSSKTAMVRRRVFMNGLFYVIGFSSVFITLGIVFGLGGVALARYQVLLTRIGGVFISFFGLYLILSHVVKKPILLFLSSEHKIRPPKALKPGNPFSSAIFGATFAFGWTPCVGPILGSVLLLVSTQGTVGQGAVLLLIFSLGLAIPFLTLALAVGHAAQVIKMLTRWLPVISIIGGAFLLFLGVLLVFNALDIWTTISYQLFQFINYEGLLNHL